MMLGKITPKQQFALAKFLHTLNEEWDLHGIEAVLGRARDLAPAADLACAAIRAAVTVGNRTPAIIALPGPHWRASSSNPRHTEPDAGERCSTCSEPQARCRAIWEHDHRFVSVAAHKRSRGERLVDEDVS